MIDIKEIAKTMTREEFITEILKGEKGKFKTAYNCPEIHGLMSFDSTDKCANSKIICEECWRNAVKDIKFKDDMEDEKVKELNIIEAIKYPVGTKFDCDIECDDAKYIEVVKGEASKILCWNGNNELQVKVCAGTAEMKLTPIQKPISFMEALDKGLEGKRVKVDVTELNEKYSSGIHVILNDYWNNTYHSLTDIFKMLGETSRNTQRIIKEGKWYIEESEDCDND